MCNKCGCRKSKAQKGVGEIMAYCKKCGKEIADGAAFCDGCGASIVDEVAQNDNERKTSYDGGIHKCPNCGEPLKAFATVCSSCGYELRDVKSSSALKDLVKKLEVADSEEKRSFAIKNFPVPNTKEDILEFLFMASSNVEGDDIVSNAWVAKVEQCYQKAKLTLKDDESFANIEELYKTVKSKVKKAKLMTTFSKGVSAVQKSNEAKRARKEAAENRKLAEMKYKAAAAPTTVYYKPAVPKKPVVKPLIIGVLLCCTGVLVPVGAIFIGVAVYRIVQNKKNGY